MDNREKKMELAKKLMALAERGSPGEKEVARAKLEQLMEKYAITEADLSDEKMEMHWFSFRGEYEEMLLHQVTGHAAPGRKLYKHLHGPGQRTERAVECTKAEALQIRIEFDFYKELWAEELRLFYFAFISKHEIFNPKGGGKSMDLSKEEEFRLAMMANGLQDRPLRKMIENRQEAEA
jgi:hypothetical protein